jgi:hypothetical protein
LVVVVVVIVVVVVCWVVVPFIPVPPTFMLMLPFVGVVVVCWVVMVVEPSWAILIAGINKQAR